MAVWLLFTAVCAMGVAFYLRFLIALCKEVFHTRICYLVLLQPSTREERMSEVERKETRFPRAA
jgi:hypothetical protein